jgi:TGF-beta propeptide
MRRRALTLALTLAAALSAAGVAPAATTVGLPASADVGFPFWCGWSYDWESRCYYDDGPRIPLGGANDKVWRAGLRFSLAAVPAGATITAAELRVYHDGLCVAPSVGGIPCVPPGAVVDAHRILSRSWFREREPDFDERVLDTAVVFSAADPQWLRWNVTSLARAWHRKHVANNGLLLKLQDGDEDYGVPGPYVPSSSHPNTALRPRLVVTYEATGAG